MSGVSGRIGEVRDWRETYLKQQTTDRTSNHNDAYDIPNIVRYAKDTSDGYNWSSNKSLLMGFAEENDMELSTIDQRNTCACTTTGVGTSTSSDWNFVPPTQGQNVAVNNDNNDDNMTHATFKPIVHLEEQTVDTGHEDEALIVEIPCVKLYRCGKDVVQVPFWKIHTSKSNVYFYRSCTSGKIRIIAREHETNKLRMNQFVPKSEDSAFASKSSNVYQWMAYDASIAAEKDDEAAGFTMWCIKIGDTDNADRFENEFRKAMQVN
eukprot:734920_1